jgi:hypothetical protein
MPPACSPGRLHVLRVRPCRSCPVGNISHPAALCQGALPHRGCRQRGIHTRGRGALGQPIQPEGHHGRLAACGVGCEGHPLCPSATTRDGPTLQPAERPPWTRCLSLPVRPAPGHGPAQPDSHQRPCHHRGARHTARPRQPVQAQSTHPWPAWMTPALPGRPPACGGSAGTIPTGWRPRLPARRPHNADNGLPLTGCQLTTARLHSEMRMRCDRLGCSLSPLETRDRVLAIDAPRHKGARLADDGSRQHRHGLPLPLSDRRAAAGALHRGTPRHPAAARTSATAHAAAWLATRCPTHAAGGHRLRALHPFVAAARRWRLCEREFFQPAPRTGRRHISLARANGRRAGNEQPRWTKARPRPRPLSAQTAGPLDVFHPSQPAAYK